MKSQFLKRMVALILCLCLLPVLAISEESEEDGAWGWDEDEYAQEDVQPEATAPAPEEKPAVIHSDFELTVNLHADGFPESTYRLRDWETFLQKITFKGSMNAMDFPNPYSRVYLNGGVYLDGQERLPFVYDAYHSYRYLISPAFRGDSVHFQMHNFFEFMLKPHDYWELPTQYLALLMYPEASYFIGDSYYTPIAEALAGNGTRTIPNEDLYELCELLDLTVIDDPHYERAYFYFTSLLLELNESESMLEFLGALEDYLSELDPEQEGMTITVSGNQETYVLGDTTVFAKKQVGDALSFTLNLPNFNGKDLHFQYEWTPSAQGAALTAKLVMTANGQEDIVIGVEGTGLPCEGDRSGQGRVTLALGGASMPQGLAPNMFDFRWSIDAPEMPYRLSLTIDWLHPLTLRPAVTLNYNAQMKQVEERVFVEATYHQEDFFRLNDGSLEEYKERYTPSIALALMPFLLEMPAGVIDDILDFANDTEIILNFIE